MSGSLIVGIAFGKSRVSNAYEVQGFAIAVGKCNSKLVPALSD